MSWPTHARIAHRRAFIASALLCASSVAGAQDTVYESAHFSPGTGAEFCYDIDASYWHGAAFTTTEPYRITALGGHMHSRFAANTTVFAAIFPSDGTRPPGPPNVDDALFLTPITVTEDAVDQEVTTDFVLPPGQWAIVFGSGAAGVGGLACMPASNSQIGAPLYFIKNDAGGWANLTNTRVRLFVKGEPAVRCGDGVVSAGETCDDGNVSNRDGCLNSCRVARCGDGHMGPGEECDDGNQRDNDACQSDCTKSDVEQREPRNGSSSMGGGCATRTGSPGNAHLLFMWATLAFLRRKQRGSSMLDLGDRAKMG